MAVHSAGWAMKDENKGKMKRWCGGAHVECSGRGGGGGVGVGSGVGLAAVRRSRVVMRAAEGDDEEGGDVAAAAEKGEEKEEEEEEKKQRLADEELALLRQLPLADKRPDGGENVVGAEGVPQAIIEAERKSKPLRRWRLVTYALASSAAAAQVRNTFQPLSLPPPESHCALSKDHFHAHHREKSSDATQKPIFVRLSTKSLLFGSDKIHPISRLFLDSVSSQPPLSPFLPCLRHIVPNWPHPFPATSYETKKQNKNKTPACLALFHP